MLAEHKQDKETLLHLLDHLTDEQIQAAWKAANDDHKGIIWWKVGEGKTRIALTWLFLVVQEPKPLIVCSPGAFRQWEDEINLLHLEELVVPKFLSCGKLSWRPKKNEDKETRRNKIKQKGEEIADIIWETNCSIIDELWMYKNPKAVRSNLIRQITNSTKPAIGLSGSLMTAGNLEDLFGQAKALNLDKKIADGLSKFREQYTIAITNWAGFIERYPKKGAVETIQKKLTNNVHIYFPKETKEVRDISINVDPSTEQTKLRKELVKTYAYENEAFNLEIKSAASLLVKLQQVSDGFLKDGKGHFLHVESSKMHRLYELSKELLDAGERLLVWVGFRKTANLVSEVLPCKTTILSGDGNFDVLGWRDKRVKATVATVGSGASLNDFVDIRYAIFYSTTFSALSMQQARGRTIRKSSLHNCAYYYFMQTEDFPDKRIYQMIDDNKSREELVIKAASEVLEQWKSDNPTTHSIRSNTRA